MSGNPLIAVYTIAKNEEANLEKWYNNVIEADHIVVCDTGSTDNTVELLANFGHEITVEPFRFDVARNTALALVPRDVDVCVVLDLDEAISPGWTDEIKRLWTPNIRRMGVSYESTRYDCRIHSRNGWYWKYPCHETIVLADGEPDVWVDTNITISHHPDTSKPRSQYLDLLRMGYTENNFSPRAAYFYGRELHNTGEWGEAALVLERFMRFPTIQIYDLAHAAQMLSVCYAQMQLYPEALRWGKRVLKYSNARPGDIAATQQNLKTFAYFRDHPQQKILGGDE